MTLPASALLMVDDLTEQAIKYAVRTGPAFRLQVDSIVLQDIPKMDNAAGILIRYVKWVNHLVTDDERHYQLHWRRNTASNRAMTRSGLKRSRHNRRAA